MKRRAKHAEVEIVKSIGMDIDDDLGFTVCGGQLVNGSRAPDWIAEMNGWDVHEIARAVLEKIKSARVVSVQS